MNPKIVAEIKKDYLDNADFNPEIISKVTAYIFFENMNYTSTYSHV